MNNQREQIQFVRSLRGPAASIFLALVLRGAAMTNRELMTWSGYSDKPVAQGLALLESYGLVDFHGRLNGWQLADGVGQLPLFPDSLLDGVGSRKSESFRLPALTTTTTKDHLTLNDPEVVAVVSKTGTSRNNSDLAVRDWLLRGGVGRNSPALRKLLALRYDEDYVAAHVLEYLAVRDGVVERLRPFTTGLLIRRLLDGDVAPAMRCEDCLIVAGPGGCRCDWEAVIKR